MIALPSLLKDADRSSCSTAGRNLSVCACTPLEDLSLFPRIVREIDPRLDEADKVHQQKPLSVFKKFFNEGLDSVHDLEDHRRISAQRSSIDRQDGAYLEMIEVAGPDTAHSSNSNGGELGEGL